MPIKEIVWQFQAATWVATWNWLLHRCSVCTYIINSQCEMKVDERVCARSNRIESSESAYHENRKTERSCDVKTAKHLSSRRTTFRIENNETRGIVESFCDGKVPLPPSSLSQLEIHSSSLAPKSPLARCSDSICRPDKNSLLSIFFKAKIKCLICI